MPTIATLRQSIERAATDAKDWFTSAAFSKEREDFFAKGKLGDKGTGAVYAYYDANGNALYVGEASRPIKRRMHDQTSPHKTAQWWKSWTTVRFLQIQNRTDRIALELLLIFSLKPKFNSKPCSREFILMFTDAN